MRREARDGDRRNRYRPEPAAAYADVDLYGTELPLREAVAANGAGTEADALAAFGRHWGCAEMFELARLGDQNPPILDGDVVDFHPSYHCFMAESRAARLHASTCIADGSREAAPARSRTCGLIKSRRAPARSA